MGIQGTFFPILTDDIVEFSVLIWEFMSGPSKIEIVCYFITCLGHQWADRNQFDKSKLIKMCL